MTRELIRQQPREVQREMLRQQPREALRLTPSQTLRVSLRPIPRRPTPGGGLIIPPGGRTSKGKKEKSIRRTGVQGYLVFGKKFKKSVQVSQKPLIKSEALSLGLEFAKRTERATFSLVPTTEAPIRTNIRPVSEAEVWGAGFRPPVKKGKLQPKQLTYVQRRRTRMGTSLEVKAIQSYKGNPYWKKGNTIW
jgi:hypothetical protein